MSATIAKMHGAVWMHNQRLRQSVSSRLLWELIQFISCGTEFAVMRWTLFDFRSVCVRCNKYKNGKLPEENASAGNQMCVLQLFWVVFWKLWWDRRLKKKSPLRGGCDAKLKNLVCRSSKQTARKFILTKQIFHRRVVRVHAWKGNPK